MATQRDDIAAEADRNVEEEGVLIIYSRGSASTDPFKAIKYPRRKRAAFGQSILDLTIQDWGIRVANLVLEGEATEPQKNDRITFVETGHVYSVQPGDSGSVWEPHAADTRFKTHSKRIE